MEKQAPRGSSAAAAKLLEESGFALQGARMFVADLGPGSLTGVKVAAAMVKAWGLAAVRPVAGVTAFDLVSPDRVVALPARRGHVFVRVPGEEPVMLTDAEAYAQYGELERETPHAGRAGVLIPGLLGVPPALLVPDYVAEPLISQPKDQTILGGQHDSAAP